ncbi:unnamed protein product [Rotaria sp. Silwood1]|nr:unnamed protein product [Rotaria sp. Silwood1]CAF3725398.1 unnamed protein product [Rotaria sp. Silwood1]
MSDSDEIRSGSDRFRSNLQNSNITTSFPSDILDETSSTYPSDDTVNNINSSQTLNSLSPTSDNILSNDLTNQQSEYWYNERHKQIEQKQQIIKIEENNLRTFGLEKSTKTSCDWSKVINLLDFTDEKQYSKSKQDLTRMKSCIFNAKRISDSKKLENGI